MKLNSKYHGEREYSESDIITFKKGIPGFEQLTKFILFPVEENDYFNVLHSIEDESIGIVVITTFSYFKEYEFEIPDSVVNELNIKSEENVLVLNTVTLNSDIYKITVNMKAPIVININDKVGEQMILDNQEYSIKYPLIQE